MKIFLSENLKALRKERGISQQQLAAHLDISRNKIASYEGKGIEPKLSLLLKLSTFFKVSVDDLVTRDLSEYGIDTGKADYDSQQVKVSTADQDAVRLREKVDHDVVESFVGNVERCYKMYEGFKSFYRLKSRNDVPNHEVNNLLLILDHLLKVDQTFIQTLKTHYALDTL